MSDATDPRRPASHLTGRLITALLLAAGLWLPAAALTSPAADAGTACDGVTVRVERPGSVREGCAPGAPGTGLDALTKAGFPYTFVDGQPGMVCTISGHPEPCNGAPSDAYWAYYHAAADATTWTYSTRGAGSRNPPRGSHEAWVFGAGARPSAPPPSSAPEPAPSPSPTTSPSPGPSPSPTPSPTTSGDSSTSSGSGGGASGGSGETASSDPATSRSRTGDAGGSAADDTPRPTTGGDDDGNDEQASAEADRENPPGEDADDEPDAETADEAAAGDDGEDEVGSDEEASDEDAAVRLEARDDTVTVEAPGGGRAGMGAAAGALLVVGLGAAGLLRARGRRDDLDHEA